jgi:transposase-like protein
MPLTATMQDIKAYLEKVEKNQISPQNLPDCKRCSLEAHYFKLHGYRERSFLIIVDMTVQPEYAPLVRFRCPACNKTVTYYPDFALPYKHYTRQSILGFAENYLTSETTTYQQAVMVEHEVPGYPGGEKSLAPSTLHRWITSASQWVQTTQTALNLICQENPSTRACRDLAQLTVAPCKYKSQARKNRLLGGLRLLLVENFFKATFNLSIFTNLAISCGFT